MLKDGDLLYYIYPNGTTIIIGYDSSFDSKNVSLDSLINTFSLEKVVRGDKVIWERSSNNTSSRPKN